VWLTHPQRRTYDRIALIPDGPCPPDVFNLFDALNRHRGKGQQVVRVEHVTVQAGGQAIVGAVTQGGGGEHNKSEDRAHAQAALAHAPEPALRCADPQGRPVPVAGGQGQEAVPDAWRGHRQRRAGR
jgi:hypothetical protein